MGGWWGKGGGGFVCVLCLVWGFMGEVGVCGMLLIVVDFEDS